MTNKKDELEQNILKEFMNYFETYQYIPFNNEDFAEKIKEFTKKIFNMNDEKKKQFSQDDYKEEVEFRERVEAFIKAIFQLEMKTLEDEFIIKSDILNEAELQIKFEYSKDEKSSCRGGFKDNINLKVGKIDKPKVKIFIKPFLRKFSSDNKEERISGCRDLLKTIIHEINHYKQFLMTQLDFGSNDSLRYAKEIVLQKHLNYDWYRENYFYQVNENDANFCAYKRMLEIIGNDRKLEVAMIKSKYNLLFGEYVINHDSVDRKFHYENAKREARDKIANPILDELICEDKNVGILNLYPILLREYNIDGSKKTTVELMENLQKEIDIICQARGIKKSQKKKLIKDCKEMYYELIYSQMNIENPEEIAQIATKIGKDKSQEIFVEMYKYFNNEEKDKLINSAIFYFLDNRLNSKELTLSDGSKMSVRVFKEKYRSMLAGNSEDLEIPVEISVENSVYSFFGNCNYDSIDSILLRKKCIGYSNDCINLKKSYERKRNYVFEMSKAVGQYGIEEKEAQNRNNARKEGYSLKIIHNKTFFEKSKCKVLKQLISKARAIKSFFSKDIIEELTYEIGFEEIIQMVKKIEQVQGQKCNEEVQMLR